MQITLRVLADSAVFCRVMWRLLAAFFSLETGDLMGAPGLFTGSLVRTGETQINGRVLDVFQDRRNQRLETI